MYIRTKDKIYEVTNYKWGRNSVIEEGGVFKLHCEGASGVHWWVDLLPLNQSENLEELCDEFVEKCIDNPKITNPFVIPMWDKEFIKETLKRGNIIYGAIWTSKGLIYVAKMDNEGKLELI